MGTQRVVVFFDWQNVYMRAREAFHDKAKDPAWKGQSDPIDLAHVLCNNVATRNPDDAFELTQIRIYRGRPTQQNQPEGYNAFQRQTAKWASNIKVRPTYTDLRYPDNWGQPGCDKPREKGIDVALAVDLVTMARDDEFDVGIVMSADYDLVPAVERVHVRRLTRGEGPRVEVAAWKSDQGDKPLRIKLPHHNIWCTWLDRQTYWGVADERDYTQPDPSKVHQDGRPKPGPPRAH